MAVVHELGVVEIAEAVANGSLTPSEIAEGLIKRIQDLDPRVQAFAYFDPKDIRAQAAVLTSEAKAGKLRGPLHGVPVGIKDEFWVKGQPTGMRGAGAKPEAEDATPVAKLRAAGAIIMGKTYMPVGGKVPPTHNPWNLGHTAGGSSSGSGASVGARMVPVALGEQTVGSNLRPAAYCGVQAVKPSWGVVSRYGCYPFSYTLDHPSVIGRSMADMALVLSVIAGPDPKDPTTLPAGEAPALPGTLATLGRAPKIGIVRNFFPERTEKIILDEIERTAGELKKAGAAVQDFRLPEQFPLAWHVHKIVNGVEASTFNAKRLTSPFDELAVSAAASTTASTVNRALAALIPGTYYLQAMRIRGWLEKLTADSLGDLDALVMAVAPSPAPRGLSNTGDPSLLGPWTLFGWPAIALSTALSPEGLPLGIQMVAQRNRDYHLLQVGAWSEEVLGRLPAPPLD